MWSFPLNKKTWLISPKYTNNKDDLIPFQGDYNPVYELNYNYHLTENLIIGLCLFEPQVYCDYTEYVQKSLDTCKTVFPNLKNVYVLCDQAKFILQNIQSYYNVIKIELPFYFLRSTITDTEQFTEWSANNKKAIFLIGDIRARPHRFPLLVEFFYNNDIELLHYSLDHDMYGQNYLEEDRFNGIINYLNFAYNTNLNTTSFKELYHKLAKVLPNDPYNSPDFVLQDRCGYTYPLQWNESSLNLVTETLFYENDLDRKNTIFPFTEKIWKPILSGKPFITVSENDVLYKLLEKLGFKTFLEYTNYKEKIEGNARINIDLQHLINTSYMRVKSFLSNQEKYTENIKHDILHNVNRYKQLSEETWNNLYMLCPPLKEITKKEFCNALVNIPDIATFKKYMDN